MTSQYKTDLHTLPMTKPMNQITDGTEPLIAQLKDADYRSSDGLSKSMLTHFLRSPAHYLSACDAIVKPTEAMNFGTAFHAEILQGSPLDFYAVKKKVDGRTADGKKYNAEFLAENADKAIIDEEEYNAILGMKQGLYKNETAHKLMNELTHREISFFGTRNNANPDIKPVRLKGLLDGYSSATGAIIDIKTCEDASPVGFKRAIRNFRYDIQDIHYSWLVNNAGKPFSGFYFIAVEKSPPYACAVYKVGMTTRIKTMSEWQYAIDYYGVCQSTGDFPAYPTSTIEIEIS